MDIAKLILEYLRAILSTPVIVGAIALIFIHLFRKQMGGLIDRVWRIKFPGGELSASQQERARELEPPAATGPLSARDVNLPANVNLNPEQTGQVLHLIQSERANATLWEYRYLNYYLVRNTQMVLDWLASQPQPLSLRLVDSLLQPTIPDTNERAAIVNALQTHHLITVVGDAINVTPKGRDYLQWRGPLAPINAVIGHTS